MDEIEKAERKLLRMAQEKREAYESSPKAAIDTLGEFRREMREADEQTLASAYTITKKVNQKGEVITGVYPGTYSDDSAVMIYSNGKSRGERLDKIRQIIRWVDETLDNIKHGRPAPPDLKKHLAELRASIPDRNERELIKPKG